ncbi:MAG: PKD domain-containing protein [Promethearchaeota archaeon]
MKDNQLKIASIMFLLLILCLGVVLPATASPLVSSQTYTSDDDFDQGVLVGLEHETVHDQLQLDKTQHTLPFIWVPNSNEGTVSKYDTATGNELGRYRTGPTTSGNPSRTTVDTEGSVWFGNRGTGTVVKIGLYEKGNWIEKNNDGDCDTSTDTNNDGKITGAEILPWDTDECVLFSTLLGIPSSGPRGMAVDGNNDLWAGTYTIPYFPFPWPEYDGNKFYHIDGKTGAIIDTINIAPYRSYGALIDGNGFIWSSSLENYVLKINPTTKTVTPISLSLTSYGLGIDNLGHVFVAGWGQNKIAKIDINPPHSVTYSPQYDTNCRGVAVTSDNDVWVVNSKNGNVTRLDNDLNWKATIDVGADNFVAMTTGVAVDDQGKVWACNFNDGYLHRIDPATNLIDLSVQTVGMSGTGVGAHYSYSDMTGIIAWSVTTQIGTWTVDFDSGEPNTPWGTVSWNSYEPTGTSVTIRVRSSNDGSSWSAWESATNDVPLSLTPDGQYLQIETRLQIVTGDISPILYDLTVEVGNQPPVPNANGPYIGYEGTAIFFDASGSSDPDPGDTLEFRWDFDANGIWDTGWSTNPIAPYVWGDDRNGFAIVEIRDPYHAMDTATAVVTVLNVAPSVEAGVDQTVYSGDVISFSGSFTDPGWLDTHTFTWDFDDGGGTSGTLTPSYMYLLAGVYQITLTVVDDDGGVGLDTLTIIVERIPVAIDIKPGSDPNSINPKSKGVIPVAILHDDTFDPALVDPDSVRFGPNQAEPVHWAYEDVDNDGDIDLILHFKTQATGIQAGDTEATLIADLIDGRQIIGVDSIRTVPPNIDS